MTRTPLVLLGAGGHARVCIDVVEEHGGFMIVALTGLASEAGARLFGYPIVGDDEVRALLEASGVGMVAVGQIKTAEPRIRLFDVLAGLGRVAPPIVSPRAYVSRHASVGEGTLIAHGAIVNAGARIGRNCIVNSQALVEHDAVISDHCHISTGACLNSGVHVGRGTFVGSNTSVRQGTRIGAGCVVGMAQVVLRDCADGVWMPAAR